MGQNRPRVFIYLDLMHELRKISKVEENHSLGEANSTPLYVMMHLARPEVDVIEAPLVDQGANALETQELEELYADEDRELIEELKAHPDLFRAIPFELEDGDDAIAYDFASRSLYTMHRIQDEADWALAMRTYDPTWVVGPSIPRRVGVPCKPKARQVIRGIKPRRR